MKSYPATASLVTVMLLMGVCWRSFHGVFATSDAHEANEAAAPPASQGLVCLDDSFPEQDPSDLKQQHALRKWHSYWRKVFEVWLPSSFNWIPFASHTSSTTRQKEAESALITSLNRIARRQSCDEDPGDVAESFDLCQILQVYNNHESPQDLCHGATTFIEMYELREPMEMDLGDRKVKHVEDFAYSPVIHDAHMFAVESATDQSYPELQESFMSSSWLTSWGPLSWYSERRYNNEALQIYRSRYKLRDEAFAGGSHGEVWRGHRKCFVRDDACDESEALIFKRLRIESGGYRILEAGLREVYFGNLLRGKDDVYQRHLFTQYETHFFGENGELWIVFKDAGPSLRSFLYTGINSGDFVVFTHSWLWTLIRMSLAEANREDKSAEHQFVVLDSTADTTNSSNASSAAGRQLLRLILQQVSFAVARWNGSIG